MKTRAAYILHVVLALVLLISCGQFAAPDSPGTGYRKITAADGKKLLNNGTALTLVDVKRADEYETARIPGAINIPNESIESTQPDALPDINQTVVVY